jgi:NAD(P)-dependent dehydrogenase (short-subunit alcohol dehydrogenase family)
MSSQPRSRTIVVTGVTSGVGLEIARRFLASGDNVIGIARDATKLAQTSKELGSEKFSSHVVDVARSAEVAQAFREIAKKTQTIDLLVNNAAVFKMAAFGTFSLEEIDNIIDTNLKGTLYVTHQALPLLAAGSRIVNIGSVSGTHGIENQAVYSASKFGVDGFAESLGQELSRRDIHITTICPGGIATPLWNSQNPYPGDSERLLATSDIVDVVVHVASLPKRVVFKKAILFPSNEWH